MNRARVYMKYASCANSENMSQYSLVYTYIAPTRRKDRFIKEARAAYDAFLEQRTGSGDTFLDWYSEHPKTTIEAVEYRKRKIPYAIEYFTMNKKKKDATLEVIPWYGLKEGMTHGREIPASWLKKASWLAKISEEYTGVDIDEQINPRAMRRRLRKMGFSSFRVGRSSTKGWHIRIYDKEAKGQRKFEVRERLGDDPFRLMIDKQRKDRGLCYEVLFDEKIGQANYQEAYITDWEEKTKKKWRRT